MCAPRSNMACPRALPDHFCLRCLLTLCSWAFAAGLTKIRMNRLVGFFGTAHRACVTAVGCAVPTAAGHGASRLTQGLSITLVSGPCSWASAAELCSCCTCQDTHEPVCLLLTLMVCWAVCDRHCVLVQPLMRERCRQQHPLNDALEQRIWGGAVHLQHCCSASCSTTAVQLQHRCSTKNIRRSSTSAGRQL